MLAQIRQWAKAARRDVFALYLAARDLRVPLHAKVVAACVAAYALSPIDLIPDFVPVVGYLDDLVIVPLGILLAVRLIPAGLMAELRTRAEAGGGWPASRAGAAAIVAIWALALLAAAWFVSGLFSR